MIDARRVKKKVKFKGNNNNIKYIFIVKKKGDIGPN